MASAIKLPDGFVIDPPVAKVVPDVVPSSLPEGFVIDDPVTPDVVEPDVVEPLGFAERMQANITRREEMLAEINAAEEAGEQTLGESIFQAVGKVGFGTILDVIGEGIVSGIHGLSAVIPDEIEDPIIQAAAGAGSAFLDSDLGKAGLEAIQKGFTEYNKWASENPRAARNVESVIDVGLMLAPIKGKPKVKARETFAGKAATKLEAAGVEQSSRQRTAFTERLVSPKKTKKIREEEIRRTSESGIFGGRVTEPSAIERSMADEISKIADVKPSNTILQNMNIIDAKVKQAADDLKIALRKNEVIFPRVEFNAELDRAVLRLAENPLIVGDAAATAEKVVAKMRNIVNQKPSTGSGLLAARKELDQFISSQRPKIFDPAQESALSTAVREIRRTTNDFIDTKATNVAVKDSLRQQSLLLSAVENIGPKAADEAGNAITRLIQTTGRAINIPLSQTQKWIGGLTLLTGTYALGPTLAASVPYLAALAIPAGTLYVGGKFATSAAAKSAIASILRMSDKAIRTTKDKVLLAKLKADRGAVAEIFKQLEGDFE